MTKTSYSKTIVFSICFGILLPSLALTSTESRGSEPKIASAHLCSGCAACQHTPAPVSKAVEYGCIDHMHRSGHPETQSKFAKPSLSKHYSFGYVGGAASFGGEPRFFDEGTWGVDYSGILLSKRIWLRWLHGHGEQRGAGSYQTDGPHLLRH